MSSPCFLYYLKRKRKLQEHNSHKKKRFCLFLYPVCNGVVLVLLLFYFLYKIFWYFSLYIFQVLFRADTHKTHRERLPNTLQCPVVK